MELYEGVKQILGLGLKPEELGFVQIGLRGIIVFIVSLAIVRVANKRFLAKMSAFDAILGFILASMLARAINGSAPFFPTLGAGFILVGLHGLLARLSFNWPWMGVLVKGRSTVLVKDGKEDKTRMKASSISTEDLLEEARLNGNVLSLQAIQQATLERNGQVSVVPAE
jgi:uncharacterized membrane protein YcaP (DUF421 family)